MKLLYLYGEEFTGSRAREVHTINRVHSLAQAGLQVTLLAATSERFTANSLLAHFNLSFHENLEIHFVSRQLRIGPWKMTSTRFFYRNAFRWLANARGNFDLAYVIHLKAARFLGQRVSTLPYVFEGHEIFADSYPEGSGKHRKLSELEGKVYKNAGAVVATSSYLLQALKDRYGVTAPAKVVPNSVNESFLQLKPGGDPQKVIYVGSFQSWKGVDIAIEAIRMLPDYHLDIVGGSEEQVTQLREMAPSNVKLHGFLKQEQFTPLLERAGIALIPNRLTPKSSLYSFPMKLLEYGAAGKVVVASDLPVLRELNPGTWCQLIEAENPKSLAEKIAGLKGLAPLQEQARRWTRNFTWAKQAEELKRFLGKLSQ